MKHRIVVILAILLPILLVLGAVYNLTRSAEPETKKVLINFVIDGETEPFDSYYAEHAVGEQLRIVSPQIKGGYEPRIPIYTARVRNDMNVTIIYDFKAPDSALSAGAILYQADFNTTEDWETYFNSLDGLTLTESGNSIVGAYAEIVNNALYVSDRGRILLSDDSEIYKTDSYTITFSMLFKSFNESEKGTVFGIEHSGNQYVSLFSLDSQGKVYHGSTFLTTLETDTWYTFTLHIDNLSLTKELLINGVSLYTWATTSAVDGATNVYFRFFNSTSHTEYYLDHFVIYEGAPVKN